MPPLQAHLPHPRPAWLPEVFAAVGRHGFATARQLGALVSVPVAELSHALDDLVVEGLLQVLVPTHAPHGGAPESAYLLARRGAELLRVIDEHAQVRPVRPEKSRYTLAHDLIRNEFGLVLERLASMGVIELHRFETAREKIAAVGHVASRGLPERIPLVADGLAVVTTRGHTTALMVEIDRGTVALPRMASKYAGYLAWYRDQGPLRRFGLKSLRVLTVAPNASRLHRLRQAALDATGGRGSGLFWFAPESAVDVTDPERLLGPVCTVARPGDLRTEQLFA